MTKRLLDRQISLLHYLTSSRAIFGGEPEGQVEPALQGIDRSLLDIEARFSHEKRMEKVVAVFPRTFDLLGDARSSLVREFVDACPPVDIGRLQNARQFYAFLCSRGARNAALPAFLPDVAACELALATARVGSDDRQPRDGAEERAPRGWIRRSCGVALLRAAYDIRPVFEDAGAADPVERGTHLAVVPRPLTGQPEIFELSPAVFALLANLDDWTDRSLFDQSPEATELITDLAEAGLIETGH